MELRVLSGRLGMLGVDSECTPEEFFNLYPNSKVIRIGCGKENGTIRTDRFTEPITYIGSVMFDFGKGAEKLYAFRTDDIVDSKNAYLLYGSTGSEIFTEAVYSYKNRTDGKISSYVRFYKPEFELN